MTKNSYGVGLWRAIKMGVKYFEVELVSSWVMVDE